MPTLKERHKELTAQVETIIDRAKGREITRSEQHEAETLMTELKQIQGMVQQSEDSAALMKRLGEIDPNQVTNPDASRPAYGTMAGGRVGYLDLRGAGAKASAGSVTARIAEASYMVTGSKALVPAGTVGVDIVMLPAGPLQMGQPATPLLSVLPSVVHTAPSWIYLRQSTRTNNAAAVAVGAVKPTSVYGLTPVTNTLTVVAHLSEPIDKYLLEDAPALQQFVSDELFYGLQLAVEAEVTSGSGTAPHIRGLLQVSGIQTQAFTTNMLTTTRAAITALETMGNNASLFAINPLDFQAIELTTASTSGEYYLGGPVDRAAKKLWGVPVVTTTAVPVGTAVLLDTTALSVGTDGKVQIQWSDAGAWFTQNQLVARCEGRFALDVFRPSGIVKIAMA